MSILQKWGMFVPKCDACGEELPMEGTFVGAVNALREAGWEYDPETKENYCRECGGFYEYND